MSDFPEVQVTTEAMADSVTLCGFISLHMEGPDIADLVGVSYLSDFGVGISYLSDFGVGAAAVAGGGGVHPAALGRGTLLPQRALPLLHTPATLEPGVGLQTHPTAVSQRVALIQVS